MSKKGLLIVNTGKGKGKTTAAFGIAMRSLGHDLPVCIIQFIKGKWPCGELRAAERFQDLLEVHVMGNGFTWQSENLDKDRQMAQEAWKKAVEIIQADKHSMVVLDELTYLIHYGMVAETDIINVLKNKPADMNIVVTGRYASEALIEIADLVTEMNDVKHPYEDGVEASRGIEF